MPGSIAANFHSGSRSEVLADYLFSTCGTVTPVRHQSDYGVDLYCTLTDRLGQRSVVQDYYVVQVKSNTNPWSFRDRPSVDWLVQHPAPLLLACVDKKQSVLCVYHLMPRFTVWAHEDRPESLELTPGHGDAGNCVQWKDGISFSLSAPILRATLEDLIDESRLPKLRSVLECWIRLDRNNCDLMRAGLPRFRMPPSYRTNEEPDAATVLEMTSWLADPLSGKGGIVASTESAEWIGGQLMNEGDREGAFVRGTARQPHSATL